MAHTNSPMALCQRLANRVITDSSCFSGVAAKEVVDKQVSNEAARFLKAHAGNHLTPVCFRHVYAIEWNPQSIEELLIMENRPEHVYTDVREFVPDNMRQAVGLNGGVEWPAKKLREMIFGVKQQPQTQSFNYFIKMQKEDL